MLELVRMWGTGKQRGGAMMMLTLLARPGEAAWKGTGSRCSVSHYGALASPNDPENQGPIKLRTNGLNDCMYQCDQFTGWAADNPSTRRRLSHNMMVTCAWAIYDASGGSGKNCALYNERMMGFTSFLGVFGTTGQGILNTCACPRSSPT